MKGNRLLFSLLPISLIIHLLILVIWWILKPDELASPSARHITVSIQSRNHGLPTDAIEEELNAKPKETEHKIEAVEEREIKKEIIPLPDPEILPDTYNVGDEMESTNQLDRSITEVSSGVNVATEKEKIAKQTGGGVVTTEAQTSSQAIKGVKNEDDFLEAFGGAYNTLLGYDDETNESQGEAESSLKSKNENTADKEMVHSSYEVGNYQLLSDLELDKAFVKDPFSEKKGKELKLINLYIKQISDVIFSHWINPLTPAELKEKTFVKIQLHLNRQGFLEEPSLYSQSRFPKLDQSLLLAIKASMNHQFQMPESYLKKYAYLTLSWSSDGSEYELMPFEQEAKQKE